MPIGAGLASSAALEVATATLVEVVTARPFELLEKAELCQRAEQRYAGVPCGIMDQFTCAAARLGCALLLDCRSLEVRWIPFDDPDVSVLIVDSGIRRDLADGAYARTRAECSAAARALGVRELRDVTIAQLDAAQERLDEVEYRRAHHVVGEIERTRAAFEAMAECAVATVGCAHGRIPRFASRQRRGKLPRARHAGGDRSRHRRAARRLREPHDRRGVRRLHRTPRQESPSRGDCRDHPPPLPAEDGSRIIAVHLPRHEHNVTPTRCSSGVSPFMPELPDILLYLHCLAPRDPRSAARADLHHQPVRAAIGRTTDRGSRGQDHPGASPSRQAARVRAGGRSLPRHSSHDRRAPALEGPRRASGDGTAAQDRAGRAVLFRRNAPAHGSGNPQARFPAPGARRAPRCGSSIGAGWTC